MIGWQVVYSFARKCEQKKKWTSAESLYNSILRTTIHADPRVHYRLGNVQFQLNDYESARQHIEIAVIANPNNSYWLYRLGFIQESLKLFSAAQNSYERAILIDSSVPEWHYRLAGVLASLKQYQAARESINKAISINSSERKYYKRLASITRTSGELWQEIEVLEAGEFLHTQDMDWQRRLGETNQKMLRFEKAAVAYANANNINGQDSTHLYNEARCWQLNNNIKNFQTAKHRAIGVDSYSHAKELGYGRFLEHKGKWSEAIDEYSAQKISFPTSPILKYRLGNAYAHTYQWSKAEFELRGAIQLSWLNPEWHYKLGFVMERQNLWDDAASSYTNAISLHPKEIKNYWAYRLGFVLNQGARYEESCQAFLLAINNPINFNIPDQLNVEHYRKILNTSLSQAALDSAIRSQRADSCFDLGDLALELGNNEYAAECYRQGLQRQTKHSKLRFERYAQILFRVGQHQQASNAFLDTYIYKNAHGVDTKKYTKNSATKMGMDYVEYSETIPINADLVLFESSHGASAGCNPLRISLQLLGDESYSSLTHIWVINNIADIPETLANRNNVIFVPRDSDLYLRYLASAKYLINNNTFPHYFLRREGQYYLNTWHGTPVKTLGKDIKGGFMDHRNAARNFLQATHMIAPNKYTADLLIEKYDISGLAKSKIALTGYPRIDSTLNLDSGKKETIRKRLKITENDQVVLYAPTWRGNLNQTSAGNADTISDLQSLAARGYKVLYRGHAMVSSLHMKSELDEYLVPTDIDTNDLLTVVDVLITDYSSIFFDYMPLRRQIVLYAYDEDEYRAQRGLYLDLEELPVTVCKTISEVISAIDDYDSSLEGKFDEALQQYCPREDGHATQRAINFFLNDSSSDVIATHIKSDQKQVLIYQGSFIPNGITSSYLSLVGEILNEDTQITVVIEPSPVAADPRRVEMFNRNPDEVQVIGRVGGQLVTAEERWIIDQLNVHGDLESAEQWEIYDRAFHREYRRIFGSSEFDTIICFEGYARFWAALLGNSNNHLARTIIYLHNDMIREWQTRFYYLQSIFRLYRNYDKMVSVAKSVHEVNMDLISNRFSVDPSKFTYVNNVINPDDIALKALEPLDQDISIWLDHSGPNFVTVGRLSPEKDHAKLINAFRQIVDENNDAKLMIVGDGPLRDILQRQIDNLGLARNILLTGLRLNPYPIISAADCFVFSSNYEGQGLVVLEALVLGLPVISTDVVGPKSILEDGSGLLVENSDIGLSLGMKSYLSGNLDLSAFDPRAYVKDAVNQFSRVLSE